MEIFSIFNWNSAPHLDTGIMVDSVGSDPLDSSSHPSTHQRPMSDCLMGSRNQLGKEESMISALKMSYITIW